MSTKVFLIAGVISGAIVGALFYTLTEEIIPSVVVGIGALAWAVMGPHGKNMRL